jgi:hypothetical protein
MDIMKNVESHIRMSGPRGILAGAGAFALLIVFMAAAALAQDAARFTVRSESYVEKADIVKVSEEVSAKGYHPVIETEHAAEGDFYYLQMGTFGSSDTALRLVVILKKLGYEFMVVDSSGAKISPIDSPALVSPERTAKLFPYEGEPQVDQWSLLESVPSPRAAGGDQGATQTAQINFKRAKPKELKMGLPEVPEPSAVAKELRDLAWGMREHGFDAYFEGETYFEPSGVLAGVFDTSEEAESLAAEMKSYGYEVAVKQQDTGGGARYSVYAQVDELPKPMITTIDQNGQEQTPETASQTDVTLEKLTKPKRSVVIKSE